MRYAFAGDLEQVEQGIAMMGDDRRLRPRGPDDPELRVTVGRCGNGLEVRYDGASAAIAYERPADFFRAWGLLAEALQCGTAAPFEAKQQAAFATCGVMLDCSRNAVPTTATVRHLLRTMALMGLNALMLYTEDTYEVPDEPYFGYMRGAYSHDELAGLDEYAAALGIEMIPCIQTLAHLESFLKWPQSEELRDTDEVLLAGSEPTYAFLERTIAAATAPFRSRAIHLGMDEAHGLGLGAYIRRFGYADKHDIMRRHLARVLAITDKLGLRPMMWGDMFFRMSIDGGGYYDENVVLTEEAKRSAVPGVRLVYWDYYHNEPSFYREYIRRHIELGGAPVFCGGVCTWIGMIPNYPKTELATVAGLSACRELGVTDVFASMWNDSGEQICHASLAGWQLYAELNYAAAGEPFDREAFRRRVAWCTGAGYDDFYALGSIDDIGGRGDHGEALEPSNPQRYLLWQDLLLGLFDKHVEHLDTRSHYAGYAERMAACERRCAEANEEVAGVFRLASRLADALAVKAGCGLRLKRAYDDRDRAELARMAGEELPDLREKVARLRDTHRRLWFATYKPFGWEALDLKYGGLLIRIDAARERVEQYVRGEIADIEELAAKRLTYDGSVREGAPGHFNRYTRIATPNVYY